MSYIHSFSWKPWTNMTEIKMYYNFLNRKKSTWKYYLRILFWYFTINNLMNIQVTNERR